MRVIATKMGFYKGSRVRVDQEFDVPEGMTGKWFSPVTVSSNTDQPKTESVTKPARKPGTKPKDFAPTTLSEIANLDSDAQIPKGASNGDRV